VSIGVASAFIVVIAGKWIINAYRLKGRKA